MRHLFIGLALTATSVAADVDLDAFNYVQEVVLEDGRRLTTGQGDYATELMLDGEVLIEEMQIELVDAGAAGILVEIANGGNACPYSFRLINRVTGQFRTIEPDSERPEVFAECEALMSVVPDANLILTWRYDTRSYAKSYVWNGYAMSVGEIAIPRDEVPEPEGGEMVARWDGADPFEMLKDPVEQNRLLRVISEEDFERLSWFMSFRSPAKIRDGFLVADGCIKYLCDAQNAVVAIRVSDGQPFVRIYDEGDVTLGLVEGEDMPPALVQHALRAP
ncbi:MAG: hypothetical protein P8L68_10600 [Paracoccaceae bacterium]|nr:hypothetical protein [Paracoccaceae bacterium]MDG1738045.1 hypothetical protein [Paracoccaceae bacterium]MDG2258930.1 hypothetical protein [Paracoccaceae bacterium]